MDYFSIAMFIAPIAIVCIMIGFGIDGKKVNVQGAILLVIGGVEKMDWSFLPTDASSSLITGSGIAVIIASQFTKRATP